MSDGAQLLLVGGVAAVGVLHTVVPDHWMPIALLARQHGWSRAETALAALQAGTGHVVSTLLIGLAVWLGGVAFARSFGAVVDFASSLALVGFGAWIALAALVELRRAGAHAHSHSHDGIPHQHHGHRRGPEWSADPLYMASGGDAAVLTRHSHLHRHGGGAPHLHWHDHLPDTVHPLTAALAADPPLHRHGHKTTARMALVLILGSSPMVEGLPAFFAAGKYGAALIGTMAAVFAAATIATYVVLCVYSSSGLQHLRLGRFERYGEVLSGVLIAAIGVAFWLWPIL
jgi:hypothetical protein